MMPQMKRRVASIHVVLEVWDEYVMNFELRMMSKELRIKRENQRAPTHWQR